MHQRGIEAFCPVSQASRTARRRESAADLSLPWHKVISPADGKKNVLILYGERLDLPAIRAAEQSLRETFAASAAPQVKWFAEYFDFARFPTAEHRS